MFDKVFRGLMATATVALWVFSLIFYFERAGSSAGAINLERAILIVLVVSIPVLLYYILVIFFRWWAVLLTTIVYSGIVLWASGPAPSDKRDFYKFFILVGIAAGPSMLFDVAVRFLSWIKMPYFSGTQADHLLTWATLRPQSQQNTVNSDLQSKTAEPDLIFLDNQELLSLLRSKQGTADKMIPAIERILLSRGVSLSE